MILWYHKFWLNLWYHKIDFWYHKFVFWYHKFDFLYKKKIAVIFLSHKIDLPRKHVRMLIQGREFEPKPSHIIFEEVDQEIISTAILSLPLIQEV